MNYLEAIQGIEDKYIPAHTLCMNLEVLPNLLPEGARKREQEKRYKRYIAIGTIAIAAILCLLSLNVWSTARNADLRIKIEQKTLESMQRGLNSIGKENVTQS